MRSTIDLSLIVARSRNGFIGIDGDLPWRLRDDLLFFKKVTLDHPIIMGRKTWESLPRKPLPKRDNIVLSRDWNYQAEGARVYADLAPAIEAGKALAQSAGKDQAFIIGGEAIYKAALPYADRLYITEVDMVLKGDASFPNFDEGLYEEVSIQAYAAGEANQYDFRIRVLKRKTGEALR